MEIRALDLSMPATVRAVQSLVEHDLPAEFRSIAAAQVEKSSSGVDPFDSLIKQEIENPFLLGVLDDEHRLVGAAGGGWRHGDDDNPEAVIAWAHARENRVLLRTLLASAITAAIAAASSAGVAVERVVAFDSSPLADNVDGLPTARRAVTHDVLSALGFSSAPERLLLEGPARARLRRAEPDNGAVPEPPDGFGIVRTGPDDRFELRVHDSDGRLVTECGGAQIGVSGAEIFWLWTEPRWRNEGFARLLVRHALTILDNAGAQTVRVQVDVEDRFVSDRGRRPTLGLFTSLGFHVADELCRYRLRLPTTDQHGDAGGAVITEAVRYVAPLTR